MAEARAIIDVRAWSTYNAGFFAWDKADLPSAATRFHRSLGLLQIMEDQKGGAKALGMLGAVSEHQGRFSRTVKLDEQSLALFRHLGTAAGVAKIRDVLGLVAVKQGDLT